MVLLDQGQIFTFQFHIFEIIFFSLFYEKISEY